jgi:hypothetical protein
MVSIPEPEVEVRLESLGAPDHPLEAAELRLDGQLLAVPPLSELTRTGLHRIFDGELAPGRHTLETRLTYVDAASPLDSTLAGFRWKLHARTSFEVQRGLRVRVIAAPLLLRDEGNPQRRLTLAHRVEAQMLETTENIPALRPARVVPSVQKAPVASPVLAIEEPPTSVAPSRRDAWRALRLRQRRERASRAEEALEAPAVGGAGAPAPVPVVAAAPAVSAAPPPVVIGPSPQPRVTAVIPQAAPVASRFPVSLLVAIGSGAIGVMVLLLGMRRR